MCLALAATSGRSCPFYDWGPCCCVGPIPLPNAIPNRPPPSRTHLLLFGGWGELRCKHDGGRRALCVARSRCVWDGVILLGLLHLDANTSHPTRPMQFNAPIAIVDMDAAHAVRRIHRRRQAAGTRRGRHDLIISSSPALTERAHMFRSDGPAQLKKSRPSHTHPPCHPTSPPPDTHLRTTQAIDRSTAGAPPHGHDAATPQPPLPKAG